MEKEKTSEGERLIQRLLHAPYWTSEPEEAADALRLYISELEDRLRDLARTADGQLFTQEEANTLRLYDYVVATYWGRQDNEADMDLLARKIEFLVGRR